LEEEFLDRAVRRILAMKIKTGMFENPYPQEEMIAEAYGNSHCKEHNLKAARESIVLLKNDNNILPLRKDIKNIAVLGPHADSLRLLFGRYTYPAMVEMMMTGDFAEMVGALDDTLTLGAA
jgi:beta-glucosidase